MEPDKPMPVNKKHKSRARLSRRVRMLVAAGFMPADIAEVLDLSVETLERLFGDSLRNGGAIARAEMVEMLELAARKGNVAAMKYLDQRYAAPGAKPELGKKAQRVEAAKTAGQGTEWGDDLMSPVVRIAKHRAA